MIFAELQGTSDPQYWRCTCNWTSYSFSMDQGWGWDTVTNICMFNTFKTYFSYLYDHIYLYFCPFIHVFGWIDVPRSWNETKILRGKHIFPTHLYGPFSMRLSGPAAKSKRSHKYLTWQINTGLVKRSTRKNN